MKSQAEIGKKFLLHIDSKKVTSTELPSVRRFKTNDEAVLPEKFEFRDQQLEAIIVICNLNGSITISPSEEMAEVNWFNSV
jgi:hypothetical protein